MQSRRDLGNWVKYLLALLLIGIVFLLVIGFRQQLQPHAYALFLFAVVATAFFGGLGPALVAIVLALAAMNYVDFLSHSIRIDFNDVVELAIFIAMALAVTFLTAARQRAERELATANTELRELDRAKDRFIAMVSHELKSRVTAILGWALVMRSDDDPEVRATGLSAIEGSARAQARLIEDLLDMSRLVLGKLSLQIAPTAFVPIVRQAVEASRPTADAKGISLQLDLPPNPCVVDGDATRLQQICTNLLSNAVKFTPKGGRVHMDVTCESTVQLTVSDTGDGISGDLLPHVLRS